MALYYETDLSCYSFILSFFFFNDTATTEIYTLSLHDALPISQIDAALERLARDEYGICGNCATVIGARAAQGAALRPALYRVSGGRGDARAAGLRGWTTRSLRRMRISRSTTALMNPRWCALFDRA